MNLLCFLAGVTAAIEIWTPVQMDILGHVRQRFALNLDETIRCFPGQIALLLRHHVVSKRADTVYLHLDCIAGEHVPVGPFSSHPEDVARVQGGVVAEFVDPGGRVPDLVGR